MSNSSISDARYFFRAWASNPLRVASVVPSGRALADLITSEILPGSGPVVELGPGTGVFTEALLRRGVSQASLVLVDNGREFADILCSRFPDASVSCMDATRLRHLLLPSDQRASAVISGLPLLSMPDRKVVAILKGAFSKLQAEGHLYQFTYGIRCPISPRLLQRLGLKAHSIGWVFNNFPPAQVYRISREERNLPSAVNISRQH